MAPPFAVAANPLLETTFVAGQPGPSFATGPQGAVGLQVADITLTSAQILALFTGAITLIPGPSTGWMIVPRTIILRLIAGSAAYTDAGGGAVSFALGSGISAALANNNIFLVTTSPNRRFQAFDWLAGAAGTGLTDTAANPPAEDGAALTIAKATGNFAAGNGTMHITIYYSIEPTT
jgi:hypothetical protein